jgi:hypothetical protein
MRLKIRGRLGRIARGVVRGLHSWRTVAWFSVWAGGGTLFGVAASPGEGAGDVVLVGLCAGLFAGFGTWFVVTLVRALGAPVDPTETVSPAELLRTDRDTALRQGLAVGVGGSVVFWLMMLFAFEPAFGLPFGQVFGRGVWFLGWLATATAGLLIWMLFVTVWGPWLIARLWLPLTGRLPWAVMTFLVDAHRRGVLRQAGGVYQFRHARLQDYFATAHHPDSERQRTADSRSPLGIEQRRPST